MKDGRITTIGATGDIKELSGRGTKAADLGGKTVLPGFVNTRSHPVIVTCLTGACAPDALACVPHGYSLGVAFGIGPVRAVLRSLLLTHGLFELGEHRGSSEWLCDEPLGKLFVAKSLDHPTVRFDAIRLPIMPEQPGRLLKVSQ